MKGSMTIGGIIAMLSLPAALFSQKKNFTYDQLFNGRYPAVFNPLPSIVGWADDNHYLEIRNEANGGQTLSVDAASGKSVPYDHSANTPKDPAPVIQGAVNITVSPDGKWAAYTRDNDLYSLHLTNGKETRLTTDGCDSIMNGYASWVYYEEILGRASKYRAFWWSPDSRYIAFMRFDDSPVPEFPIFRSEGQHGLLRMQRYPEPGDNNPRVRIGLTPAEGTGITWAQFSTTEDQYFGTPAWTPMNELWVQWMNRDQDSLIVYQINKTDGAKKKIYTEHQSTWITLDTHNRFTFLDHDGGCLIMSDKNGWENLYLYSLDGKFINEVTRGRYWNTKILKIDEKNRQLFIQAQKDNSNILDLFRVSLDGKTCIKLSDGNHYYDNVNLSPSGKYFTARYSNLHTPPAMGLFNRKGKLLRELGNFRGPEYDQYEFPRTDIVTVKSSDGLFDLPMAVTYPDHFDFTKKYPVWISIYGGPNVSNVMDRWIAGAPKTQWWAQEGIIQVTMDNRSSGHFGKAGMNYIFRKLGLWETEDFMACGRWLRSQPWTDSSRIGITGGSFGGYLTCMALTYGADVFNYGIADYSVTDWSLYDTHYTERYMDKPADNAEGYSITSVMNYVSRYKGVLKIVHGTTDDNVHLQHSLQLIDALEDRNSYFEMTFYPGQLHGIRGSKNPFDFTETSRFIYRYLLGKDLPPAFSN